MNGSLEIVTRCPGCSTAFRASQEHLSVRGGKVRCGRCNKVFDAREHALPAYSVAGPEQSHQGLLEQLAQEPLPRHHFSPQEPLDALVLTYAPAEAPSAEQAAEEPLD